jgi:hypothetical protein
VERRSQLNESFSLEKTTTSTDHEWLKCSTHSSPISGAFDGVTGLFPDSSGPSAHTTSLTSSDPFISFQIMIGGFSHQHFKFSIEFNRSDHQ